MKDAELREVEVDHFGQDHLDHRQEDALGGFAQVRVFHGRRADDDRLVNRIAPVRDRGDVQHRVLVGQRVVAGVIAERPFGAHIIRVHVAFDDELGRGGDFQVDGLAFDHFDALAADETGKEHLVDLRRQRRGRGVGQLRRRADGNGDFHALDALGLGFAHVPRRVVMNVRMEMQRAAVMDLQAVHAHVTAAIDGAFGDDQRQRDRAAAVFRPALDDRQLAHVEVFGLYNFLARPGAHQLRRHFRQAAEQRQHFDFLEEPRRRLELDQFADLVGDLVGLAP